MSTSVPSGASANTLTVMQNLTQAIQGLSEHVQSIGGGDVGNVSNPPTPSIVTADASAYAPSVSQQAALADLQARAQAQQELRQTTAQSESDGSSSTPPDGTPQPPTSSQQPGGGNTPSPGEQLTWETLANMNMGGPLGQFRRGQYQTQSYQNAASWLTSKLGGGSTTPTPMTDGDGNVMFDSETGEPMMQNSLSSSLGNSSALNTAGALALTAIGPAFESADQFANVGQALGYGNRQGFDLNTILHPFQSASEEAPAVEQGGYLRGEEFALHQGGGLTGGQARSIVDQLAGAGFSDTGVNQGDNADIASNVVKPLVQQGVSVQGAATWTDALRQGGDSIDALTQSLQDMGTAAQATKLTTDQYNSSLQSFANSQVANGGTYGQAYETGRDFTSATGLTPDAMSTLQSNPMYQGIMMGENGVLPSDIGNLTPGAQLQGVSSMINMLGGAFSSLNKNRYEDIGGVRVVSSYGGQAEAAQVAQQTGLPQAEVMRLMYDQQQGHLQASEDVLNKIGNPSAGLGGEGSGLYEILNRGEGKTTDQKWDDLSASNRRLATQAWNQGIAPDLGHLGLKDDQIRKIDSTNNIDERTKLLRGYMTGNQGKSPMNQISGNVKVQLELTGGAKNMFKVVSSKANATLTRNSGGTDDKMNSPYGDATQAVEPPPSTWSSGTLWGDDPYRVGR